MRDETLKNATYVFGEHNVYVGIVNAACLGVVKIGPCEIVRSGDGFDVTVPDGVTMHRVMKDDIIRSACGMNLVLADGTLLGVKHSNQRAYTADGIPFMYDNPPAVTRFLTDVCREMRRNAR